MRPRLPLPRTVEELGEVDKTIVDCLQKGLTYVQTAQRLTLDASGVRYRTEHLRKLYEEAGIPVKFPGKAVHVKVSKTVDDMSDLDRGIIEDYARGRTLADISRRTGLGETTVRIRLLRLRENLGLSAVPFSPGERLRDLPPGEFPIDPPSDVVRGYVRCLGGCGKMFQSPDRKRIRVCVDCKRNRAKRDIFHVEYHCSL